MSKLEDLVQRSAEGSPLINLIRDARRFILYYKWVIENSPLQIYSSGLVFSPTRSPIKELFSPPEPRWLVTYPTMEDDWSACLQTLESHSGSINSVIFSHDSTLLASASNDGTIKVWDVNSDRCLQILKSSCSSDSVNLIIFFHNSTRLASVSNDEIVKIWDVSSGKCLQTLEKHSGYGWVNSLIFSHESTLLTSVSHGKTVKIWDVSNGKCLQTLGDPCDWVGYVNSIAFSHDSTLLATGYIGGRVKIWNLSASSNKCLQTCECHNDWINSVVFSHDSTLLASTSCDGTVKIWNISRSKCQQSFNVGREFSTLLFDITSSCLHTDIGTIPVSLSLNVTPTTTSSEEPRLQGYGLSFDRTWVTWNSKNLLWLPPNYRPFCSAAGSDLTYLRTF